MPVAQSKINVDNKHLIEDEAVKAKGHSKTKNRDRNTFRRNEPVLDRPGQLKRRKSIVPELDLKPVSPNKNKRTALKDDSTRRPKNNTTIAKCSKQRQLDIENECSKTNIETVQVTMDTEPSSYMDEVKSSRSLFFFSPRQVPNNSLADGESINPNPSDKFYECNELDDFFRNQFFDFENFSELDFQTPKFLEALDVPSVPSRISCNSNGSGVLKHFKELLFQEENSRTNLLGQDEIALLKDIIKADERHQKLRRDDYDLLKEILTGQLKEITQQERVIKIALKKIRSRTDDEVEVTTIKVDAAEQPMEDTVPESKKPISARSHSARSKNLEARKQQVSLIFKNVPSLEKEIRILRSLGLKLEETLKRTSGGKLSGGCFDRPSYSILSAQYEYYTHLESTALIYVEVRGLLITTASAEEFQIRQETIDELKMEREFFIPSDLVDRRFTLERTNFHKLSRNPELLLKRLKPVRKGDSKFNFIEQNPIFFNHFLAKMCKICVHPVDTHDTYIPKNRCKQNVSTERLPYVKSGAGDHPDYLFKKREHELPELPVPKVGIPNFTTGKRRKKKRCTTPIANDKLIEPKNSLVRAVLVGTIQLSIIFTVVTAILYPDLICL